MGYRMLDVSAIEGRRKLVASSLEAASIRMNQFDNEPNQAGKEHDERESGQEEIYAALEGAGVIVVPTTSAYPSCSVGSHAGRRTAP